MRVNKRKGAYYTYSFVALCSLFFSIVGGMSANAESSTEGKIRFFPDDSIENPVDPGNLDRTLEPKEPPTPGPLGLAYTSSFAFGERSISTQGQEYYAALDTVSGVEDQKKTVVPNFVQLFDKSGTNQGWDLTVTQSAPLTNEQGFALENTRFIFRHLVGIGTMKEAKAPVLSEKELTVSATNQPVLVAQAKKGTGQGTWTIQFGQNEIEAQKSVSLYIPGETKKQAGTYHTSLVWTLTNGI